MNYLTALLAFSAIMIVLSTLATVAVEFLHKLGRKRAKDFDQLLSQLYEHAIEPRLTKAGLQVTSSVDDFIRAVRKNPAFDLSKRPRYAKWPVIRRFFDTAFEELTTRQFVEQFAQTEAGKKLRTKGKDEIKELIGKFSYEFERYGDAATNYFKRRATTLSVAVAFLLALFLNIDAIKLFGTLAEDNTLAESVISSVDVAKLEAKYQQRIGNADNDEAKGDIHKEYEEILDTIKKESQSLQGLGLPIGFEYFPFCESGSREGTAKLVDVRCKGISTSDYTNEVRWIGGAMTFLGTTLENVWFRVLRTRAGWGWMFSMVIAGGLIGLGAPFWFKTYSAVADFIPGLKSQDRTQARSKGSGRTTGAPATSTGGAPPAGTFTVFATGTGAGTGTGATAAGPPAPGTAGGGTAAGAAAGAAVLAPGTAGGGTVAGPAAGPVAGAVAPVSMIQMPSDDPGLSESDLYSAFDKSERN